MMVSPNMLAMESETVLTQYIIKNWTLAYNNISKNHISKVTLLLFSELR